MVAHAVSLLRRGLVGGDVEPAVNLSRVGDDYLAAELQGELKREPGLADAGGADDDGDVEYGRPFSVVTSKVSRQVLPLHQQPGRAAVRAGDRLLGGLQVF